MSELIIVQPGDDDSQGEPINDWLDRIANDESEGFSVSQKEAIREKLNQLCMNAIEFHEEVADSKKATEADINVCLNSLEAITKGDEQ